VPVPAAVVGDDKVLAAAQHIVKSLATSKNAADDMIRILSGFDHRLSSITSDLFPSPAPAPADDSDPEAAADREAPDAAAASLAAFDAAEQLIHLWDTTPEALVLEAPEDDAAHYLAAVDVAVDHLAASPRRLRPRGGRGAARHGAPRGRAPPPHAPPRRAARRQRPLLLPLPPLARVHGRPRHLLRV